jgi:tRNA-2-methylthio-N6-dimethylallyladenosine synthase
LCDEFSDSEIVASILSQTDTIPHNPRRSRFGFVNTAIRDKKQTAFRKNNAVKRINPKMKVGVLGCMAERLKDKFLEEEKLLT